MERPSKRDRTGERIEAPQASQPGCPSCNSDDPHVRARHQLVLARDGVDRLRRHLQADYVQTVLGDRRKQLIDDICQWVGQQIKVYSDFVHPDTGAHLPWWEARLYCHKGTRETWPDTDHQDAAWKTNQQSGRLPVLETQRLITETLQVHAQDPWARGHILLMGAGLGRSSNHAETAAACRQFSTQWPKDANAWEREAQWWEAGAQGSCVLTREPGEEG